MKCYKDYKTVIIMNTQKNNLTLNFCVCTFYQKTITSIMLFWETKGKHEKLPCKPLAPASIDEILVFDLN